MSKESEPFKQTEAYKKIEENSQTITQLLRENEALLREIGFDPPSNNIMLTDEASIKFPSNYIRQADYFREKYHLRDIFVKEKGDVDGKNIADNCAYALIVSDIYNYWINRFGFWGVVASLIYKDGIINFVSVIEAMVKEGTKKYACKCDHCKNKESCNKRILKADLKKRTKGGNKPELSLGEYVDLMEKLKFVENPILVFDDNIGKENVYQKLKSMIDIRNYVHITKSDVNSLNNNQFDLKNYNECLKLLQMFSAAIYERIDQQKKCFEQEADMEME